MPRKTREICPIVGKLRIPAATSGIFPIIGATFTPTEAFSLQSRNRKRLRWWSFRFGIAWGTPTYFYDKTTLATKAFPQ